MDHRTENAVAITRPEERMETMKATTVDIPTVAY